MPKFDMHYVSRRLSWTDENGTEHHCSEKDLLTDFQYPLIILGDPGMGKTELMKVLGKSGKGKFFQAASFLRQRNDSIPANSLLIIDGLDEVSAMEQQDPLHNVLTKLIACGCPDFIVSCRTAEWRNTTARLDIHDEYCHTPKELKLHPLSEDEALQILANYTDRGKAIKSIESLRSNGLTALFENPLNLQFVATVLSKRNNLPETRFDLLEEAVAEMSRENNPYHCHSVLTKDSEDEIMDVAGCIMATMLITGKERVAKAQNSEGTLSLKEMSGLADPQITEAVLGSRLFFGDVETTTESGIFFYPSHRTIAEFLGARWLARKIENTQNPKQVTQRLLGLLSAQGGFPASLRGLLAWLPKFSPERLGPKVIEQDPYSVLYYGDSDHLYASQARQIICGLERLARFDPYFIFDWWDMKSLKGLVQIELLDDIRSIIMDANKLSNLRVFFLKAIKGEPIVEAMETELREVLFDARRPIYERKQACIALFHMGDCEIDWPCELEQLSDSSSEDSDRLVVELIPEIGTGKFSDNQIARFVVAHTGLLNSDYDENLDYSYSSLSHLKSTIPEERITAVLDQLTSIVMLHRDADEWLNSPRRDAGFRTACRFVSTLVYRLVQYDLDSIEPHQLWNWMRVFWSESVPSTGDYRLACELISNDDRLRREIQRMALFTPGTEDEFGWRQMRLMQLFEKFGLSNEDAFVHLSELVERNVPKERRWWIELVDHFRNTDDDLIPEAIQKIAQPFAENDQYLIELLTTKPKPSKSTDWEKKYQQQKQDSQHRRTKQHDEMRKLYSANIDNIRSGELEWILQPAYAYLGFSFDFGLKTDCEPTERISQWLGDELKDATLEGLEAILKRCDLPCAKEFAENYAISQYWKIQFPMLAGAVHRHLTGKSFDDLTEKLVLSLAIVVDNNQVPLNERYPSLKEELNNQFSKNFDTIQTYRQKKIEIMLAAKMSNVPGLYQLVHDHNERLLSARLCLKWLQDYPALPLNIVSLLTHSVIYAPDNERELFWRKLTKIANQRCGSGKLNRDGIESEERIFWRSVQFLVDFDNAIKHIPDITNENKNLLWSLSDAFLDRYYQNEQAIPLTINQLKWIVNQFRNVWPNTERPKGVTVGITNPWDATQLIELAIDQIAGNPVHEAQSALIELREFAADSYTTKILSAIARNHRVRIEANFSSPTVCEFKLILSSQPPKSATDLQSIVLNELENLQSKLRGHELNIVNDFYDDKGKPRVESDCRDQMLIAMGNLPYEIKVPTEVRIPHNRRSDGAFKFNDITVPLEVKGQWGHKVWTAAIDQLDRYYCITHNSESKGIYVVFWFGEAVPTGKKMKLPPNNLPKPKTSEEMRVALETLVPKSRSHDVAIVVLDVSRP